MHFKFLSEVGQHYATETTIQLTHTTPRGVTSPLRKVILVGLAADVLRAKTQYEQLSQNYRSQHGHGANVKAGIEARAAAWLQAAGATPNPRGGAPAVSADEVSRAKGVYDAALRHFQNQGGVLAHDGTLDWAASDELVVYRSEEHTSE